MLKRLAIVLMLTAAAMQGAAAAEFCATDIKGVSHHLTDYRGKWVLVNLWATWCAACLHEMPELESLGKAHSDLVILGVAVDGQSPQRLKLFAEKLGVTYPVIAGGVEIARQFNLRGYPTTVLFDRSGKMVLEKEGAITRQEVERMLRAAGSS